MAIADAIALRFGGEKKVGRFPNPIDLEEVKKYFSTASELTPSKTHPSLLEVIDENGTILGQVGRTSPFSDQVIGYQGPVDTLLAFDQNGSLQGMRIRSSFENQPYADYPNDDAYFESLFTGRTIAELADMNLTEEEVEGVSGATMTSMAMAEGIVKTAGNWEQQSLSSLNAKTIDLLESQRLWVIGSNFVCRLCGLYPPWKNQILPDHPANSFGLLFRLGQRGHSLAGTLCGLGTKWRALATGSYSCPSKFSRFDHSNGHRQILLLSSTVPTRSCPTMDEEAKKKTDSGSQRIGQNIKTCTHWAPFSGGIFSFQFLCTHRRHS